ncbi:hypothetical protein BDR05DRAFT_947741 [Suillus weaverae]|nr:hypothetical protein BDR05DRAFT_947741 [Suillus weaverae]
MAKHHLRSNSTNSSIPRPISSTPAIPASAHASTLKPPLIREAGTPVATMTAASSKIAAITLSHTDLKKIELLDRGQNNWGTWSAKIRNYLLLKHGGGYLLGIITRPDDTLDPTGATTWDLNNLCIVAALSTRLCTEDQDFLLPFTDAHAAWTALKSRHEQVGPIAQILLIQQAFALCYRRSECFALTSTQLMDLARHIYAIGILKEEDFLTILMLNAMSEDLPHTQSSSVPPLLPTGPLIFVPVSSSSNNSSTMTKGKVPGTSL